jgi:hypothetical protein
MGQPVSTAFDGQVVAAVDRVPERTRIHLVRELALVANNMVTFDPARRGLDPVAGNLHLHFQLMDSADPLQAKGIPCAFEAYLVQRDGGWERVECGIPGRGERIRSVLEGSPEADRWEYAVSDAGYLDNDGMGQRDRHRCLS